VRALLGDESRRNAMGVAAGEDASRRFGLRRMVDAYLDWYEEVLADPQP
jgi:hypothetical protein